MIYLVTNEKEKFSFIKAADDVTFAEPEDVINYFKDKEEVEFDTETTGLVAHNCKILSAQFGDYENQFVIDALTVDVRLFKNLLETKTILMQNAKFDLKFLYVLNIWPNKVYDTFLAEAVLYMGVKKHRKSLDILVERYLNISEVDKSIRGSIHKEGLSLKVIKYGAGDVKYLGKIKEKQNVLLEQKGLHRALNLDNKFVRVLAFVEHCGFKLDADKWQAKIDKDRESLDESIKQLDNYIFENNMTDYIDGQLDMFNSDKKTVINWSSSPQVIKLFQELGINTKTRDKNTGGNKDSVEAGVLAPQKDKFPIIPLYTKYQKAQKLVTTYGENVLRQINKNTNRLHTEYRQLMDTGRMSCGGTDRARGIEMLNLQNVPADEAHRSCFVPEEGNKLVVADYSGQESVVFANFCKDPEILAFYQQGLGDMHSFIASKIYPELEGLDLKTIKSEHKQKRQNAKAAGFAIQYGGVGATIAANLNLSIEEGDEIYNGYFKAFPGIKNYFATCKKRVLANGYVQLNPVSLRKSYVDFYDDYLTLKQTVKEHGFWDDYRMHKEEQTDRFFNYYKPRVREYFKFEGMMERKSLNYPIQGTSAEITKFASLKFFNILVDNSLQNKVKICNIVHDEIVIECPEDMAEDMGKLLQECMEDAGKPFCKIIPLKAEPCVTEFWEH